MMFISLIYVLIINDVSTARSFKTERFQTTLQSTIEKLFTERFQFNNSSVWKLSKMSVRQNKICKRNPGLVSVLNKAKEQAIYACEDDFRYDRWNCSETFNNKVKKRIFNKIHRETAYVYSLMAASISHAVAKGCASGDLNRCSCYSGYRKTEWKKTGCNDDFKYAKRLTKNFLEFKKETKDIVSEVLKQDVTKGFDSMARQMKEVCKCHGFSGSCTTKTCWKRLGPFNSVMGLLKKYYHRAIKRKVMNTTSIKDNRKKMKIEKRNLVYLHKTPNLCIGTKGRVCKDRDNCSILCCGRGYLTSRRLVRSSCRCKMEKCCTVECDTCVNEIEIYTCK